MTYFTVSTVVVKLLQRTMSVVFIAHACLVSSEIGAVLQSLLRHF